MQAPTTKYIDIEFRRTLHEMIETLDAQRSPAQRTGGLHKWLNDDGRVLWLCPTHYRPLQSRVDAPQSVESVTPRLYCSPRAFRSLPSLPEIPVTGLLVSRINYLRLIYDSLMPVC